MRGEIRSYRDLEVWQEGVALVVSTYEVVKLLPSAERYGLSSQMCRAATSIPANVAEGHAKRGRPYLFHVNVALGSTAELETHIEVASRLGYLSADVATRLAEQAACVGRMLSGLRRSLRLRLLSKAASAGCAVLVLLSR